MYLPKNAYPKTIGVCRPTQLTFYDMKYGKEFNASADALNNFRITKENTYYCLKVNLALLYCHSKDQTAKNFERL